MILGVARSNDRQARGGWGVTFLEPQDPRIEPLVSLEPKGAAPPP
jgi:hypothetical protein